MSTKAYPVTRPSVIQAAGAIRLYDGSELALLFEKYAQAYSNPNWYINKNDLLKMKRKAKTQDDKETIELWLKLIEKTGVDELEFEVG